MHPKVDRGHHVVKLSALDALSTTLPAPVDPERHAVRNAGKSGICNDNPNGKQLPAQQTIHHRSASFAERVRVWAQSVHVISVKQSNGPDHFSLSTQDHHHRNLHPVTMRTCHVPRVQKPPNYLFPERSIHHKLASQTAEDASRSLSESYLGNDSMQFED